MLVYLNIVDCLWLIFLNKQRILMIEGSYIISMKNRFYSVCYSSADQTSLNVGIFFSIASLKLMSSLNLQFMLAYKRVPQSQVCRCPLGLFIEILFWTLDSSHSFFEALSVSLKLMISYLTRFRPFSIYWSNFVQLILLYLFFDGIPLFLLVKFVVFICDLFC